ncbi:MAG: hypothetical protein ACMUIP_01645 [bacterium]
MSSRNITIPGFIENAISHLPRFDEIAQPTMVALVGDAGGSGSKVFQSFLDNHEEIFMIPAYPLMYFYPHWDTWEKELKDTWNWESLIDIFCHKHASVLDSRNIRGFNGLTILGKNQDECIKINENVFRSYLLNFLKDQSIHRKVFLLAVHYAYALCNNEDIGRKKALLYHIHSSEYMIDYLMKDFPDLKVMGMVRDPRPNLKRRFKGSLCNVDDIKLNRTDALIYRKRVYYQACKHVFYNIQLLHSIASNKLRVIRHEDLVFNLKNIMQRTAEFLQITHAPSMLEISFGGKSWWGDQIYDMKLTNTVNPSIVSQQWQEELSKIDWFVIEGLMFDYLKKYGYTIYKYTHDSLWQRCILAVAIMLPSRIEQRVLKDYLTPMKHIQFLKACIDECTGKVPRKDYTWNASYLYKWTYIDLKLWRTPWYVTFVSFARRLEEHRSWQWLGCMITPLSRLVYVLANYCRYWWAIFTYPLAILKRCKLCYSVYVRRIKKQLFLPEMINPE